jgi:hypothetical protein
VRPCVQTPGPPKNKKRRNYQSIAFRPSISKLTQSNARENFLIVRAEILNSPQITSIFHSTTSPLVI